MVTIFRSARTSSAVVPSGIFFSQTMEPAGAAPGLCVPLAVEPVSRKRSFESFEIDTGIVFVPWRGKVLPLSITNRKLFPEKKLWDGHCDKL